MAVENYSFFPAIWQTCLVSYLPTSSQQPQRDPGSLPACQATTVPGPLQGRDSFCLLGFLVWEKSHTGILLTFRFSGLRLSRGTPCHSPPQLMIWEWILPGPSLLPRHPMTFIQTGAVSPYFGLSYPTQVPENCIPGPSLPTVCRQSCFFACPYFMLLSTCPPSFPHLLLSWMLTLTLLLLPWCLVQPCWNSCPASGCLLPLPQQPGRPIAYATVSCVLSAKWPCRFPVPRLFPGSHRFIPMFFPPQTPCSLLICSSCLTSRMPFHSFFPISNEPLVLLYSLIGIPLAGSACSLWLCPTGFPSGWSGHAGILPAAGPYLLPALPSLLQYHVVILPARSTCSNSILLVCSCLFSCPPSHCHHPGNCHG